MEPVRRPAGTAPLAIELGQDASVSLHVFGETPASTFGPDQIAALFEVGLATAEEDENMLVPVGELELADVRFLVGAVELDPAVGMAAVERGLREAIRRWLRHRADSPQEPEPGPPAAGPVVADTATVETAVDTDKAGASEYVGPAVPPDGPEPTVVMISTEQWLESPWNWSTAWSGRESTWWSRARASQSPCWSRSSTTEPPASDWRSSTARTGRPGRAARGSPIRTCRRSFRSYSSTTRYGVPQVTDCPHIRIGHGNPPPKRLPGDPGRWEPFDADRRGCPNGRASWE